MTFWLHQDLSCRDFWISGYDAGDKGKHSLEDICRILVARSSRTGYNFRLTGWTELIGGVEGASLECGGKEWCITEPEMIGWLKGLIMVHLLCFI
jgi:hypothetical protein